MAIEWGQIVTTGLLLVALAGAAWRIFEERLKGSDKRLDLIQQQIDQIREDIDSHVSQEQHDEFVKRVDQYMATDFIPRYEFDRWVAEREKRVEAMVRGLGLTQE